MMPLFFRFPSSSFFSSFGPSFPPFPPFGQLRDDWFVGSSSHPLNKSRFIPLVMPPPSPGGTKNGNYATKIMKLSLQRGVVVVVVMWWCGGLVALFSLTAVVQQLRWQVWVGYLKSWSGGGNFWKVDLVENFFQKLSPRQLKEAGRAKRKWWRQVIERFCTILTLCGEIKWTNSVKSWDQNLQSEIRTCLQIFCFLQFACCKWK